MRSNSLKNSEQIEGTQDSTIIEFREVCNHPQKEIESLKGNKVDGYEVIYNEKEPLGYSISEPKVVAEKSDIVVTKSDIKKVLARENSYYETRNIIFVLSEKVSPKIIEMGEKNRGKKIAFIVNGKLLEAPRVIRSLKTNLNKDGQFEWGIPTHYKTKEEVNEFLNKYNLRGKLNE